MKHLISHLLSLNCTYAAIGLACVLWAKNNGGNVKVRKGDLCDRGRRISYAKALNELEDKGVITHVQGAYHALNISFTNLHGSLDNRAQVQFAEIWDIYPNKQDKSKAFSIFVSLHGHTRNKLVRLAKKQKGQTICPPLDMFINQNIEA